MSTPPHYFGRISPIPFAPINALWPFNTQLPLATPYNLQIPVYSNQFSIPYLLPHQPIFNAPNNAYFNSGINQMQARGRQGGLSLSTVSPNGALQNKNQKKKKATEQLTVNLISDDEEPVQLEKPSEQKNTSNSSKINEFNLPANPPQLEAPQIKETKETKIVPKEKPQPKQKQELKTFKTKQINKETIIYKKPKLKPEAVVEFQKRRQVFSQRIVQKQDSKKEPFRIPKRQRQLLQVGSLRQHNLIIMTGPQFQAKLPKHVWDTEERSIWLSKTKSDLLSRQYKEQQQ